MLRKQLQDFPNARGQVVADQHDYTRIVGAPENGILRVWTDSNASAIPYSNSMSKCVSAKHYFANIKDASKNILITKYKDSISM